MHRPSQLLKNGNRSHLAQLNRTAWHYTDRHFSHLTITASSIVECGFNDCVFQQIKIRNTSFKSAIFQDCSFENCLFKDSNFKNAQFINCKFLHVRFDRCVLPRMIRYCSLIEVSILNQCTSSEGPDFKGTSMAGCEIAACDCEPVNFGQVKLTKVEFHSCHRFFLGRIKFQRDALTECKFIDCHFSTQISFAECDLRRVEFLGVDANSLDMSSADLRHAVFADCNLPAVKLSNSDLSHAEINKCNFSRGNFKNTDFQYANIANKLSLSNAHLDGASFDFVRVGSIEEFVYTPVRDLGRFRGTRLFKKIPLQTRSISATSCNHLKFRDFCECETARNELFLRAHDMMFLMRPLRLLLLEFLPLELVGFIDHAFKLMLKLFISFIFSVLLFSLFLTAQTEQPFYESLIDMSSIWKTGDKKELINMAKGFIVGGLLASFVSELFAHYFKEK